MRFLVLFLVAASSVLVVSCGVTRDPNAPSYEVKRKLYEAVTPEESSIKISLWDQKAWLLNGAGEAVLQTDVATGVPGKETPTGVFPVLERLETKRSNRYGKLVDIKTREVVVAKAWEHEGPIPAGSEYEGIAMPYWMRLTWYGVGMHVGSFKKRTRSSFGCVRVFEDAQPLIFAKTQKGTKVEIVKESLVRKFGWVPKSGWLR